MSSERPNVPPAIKSPIDGLNTQADQWTLYDGPCTFDGRDGTVVLTLDFLPRPKVRFKFEPTELRGPFDLVMEPWPDSNELIIDGPSTQKRITVVTLHRSKTISGIVTDALDHVPGTTARMLVINGPETNGSPIEYPNLFIRARTTAEIAGWSVTLDALPREKKDGRGLPAYRFTHVLELKQKHPGASLKSVKEALFWTLSFMIGRWVGLIGPWFYDSDNMLCDYSLEVTKVSLQGNSQSWFNAEIGTAFSDLAPKVHATLNDPKQHNALMNAMHWAVESSLCAGGVEGSLILQQSALECLAWHELYQVRQSSGKKAFKNRKAEDKIRDLLKLWHIDTSLPAKHEAIAKYATETQRPDIPSALTGIRNILVHAEPDRSLELFSRPDSPSEISQLYRVCKGVLHQAVLASLGYQGEIVRHDRDVTFITQAIERVPWK